MIPDYFPADPRHYVREELEMRQTRRPQYSLRAFARDLEMSASFLCEFLNGRQGLSKERVYTMSDKLKLTSDQREHFWDLVESRFGRTGEAKKAASFRAKDRFRDPDHRLTRDRFLMISDWAHFVLLELLTVNPLASIASLSQALKSEPGEVRDALNRLHKLKLITEIPGGWRVVEDETVAGGHGPDAAVQAAHESGLRKHLEFCADKAFDARENVSMSFSINQDQWPDLRRDLQKAILRVVSKHGHAARPKDQVVSLALQMVTLI